MGYCIKAILVLILLSFSSESYSYAGNENIEQSDKLILVGSVPSKEYYHQTWLLLIYEEVAKRLNLTLQFEFSTAKRASIYSDRGIVHGEISRVFEYGKSHPNLIRVEEPNFSIFFAAYSYRKDLSFSSWKDFNNSDFSVAYRMGVFQSKNQLEKLKIKEIMAVPNNQTALKMLSKKRFDIFIDIESNVDQLIKSHRSLDSINKVGVIEELPTYAYIHKKYSHLADKIAKVLKEMKSEGIIEKFKVMSLKEHSQL